MMWCCGRGLRQVFGCSVTDFVLEASQIDR